MASVLPEDLADFAWIAQSGRPLVVCDVDEVVLEFIAPFQSFLAANGHRLSATSFRLHGNITSEASGAVLEREAVRDLIERFFLEQDDWQRPVDHVAETLGALRESADIVFLTAMAPRHFARRRALLDSHGLAYPMIATEDAKGLVLGLVHGERETKTVFIDDIIRNLHSVRDHLPKTLLLNFVANETFRALAPDPGEGIARPQDWRQAHTMIRAFLDA